MASRGPSIGRGGRGKAAVAEVGDAMSDSDVVSEDLFDEDEVFLRYQESRDTQLRDELFLRYLGVVEASARSFWGVTGVERDDIVQVGYLGLLGAIERYDPKRGAKFSTYARHCVDGEIRHFIRDKAECIRKPRWMRKLSRDVASFLENYLQQHQRLPTLSEISYELNIAEDGVIAILQARQPVSLEDEGASPSMTRHEIRSLRHVAFQLPIEDRILISEAFDKLLSLEKQVVYLFFVKDLTQKEIAGELLLSPRKVSRLMQKGLDRLRHWLGGEISKDDRLS